MTDLGPGARLSVVGTPTSRWTTVDLLTESVSVVHHAVEDSVRGLTPEQLAFRPSPTSPSMAWLIWHLTRVQDLQAALLFGHRQVWHAGPWAARFALPFDGDADGVGQGPEEAATVWVESGTLLIDYHRDVSHRTVCALAARTDADLARLVDDPGGRRASVGGRLNRVIAENLRRVGQAAYVRGLLRHGPY